MKNVKKGIDPQGNSIPRGVFGLLKDPKRMLYSIYEPKRPWSTKEIISALIIIYVESYIFIFTLESWFYFETNYLLTILHAGILFAVISLPLGAISKKLVPTVIWHSKILIFPAIACLIMLIILFPIGIINLIVVLQVTIFIIVLIVCVVWALAWKLYSHVKLFRKEDKPQIGKALLFTFYDELVLSGFLIYMIYYYFLDYLIKFVWVAG